jgi:hypothetical protein
MGIQRVLS